MTLGSTHVALPATNLEAVVEFTLSHDAYASGLPTPRDGLVERPYLAVPSSSFSKCLTWTVRCFRWGTSELDARIEKRSTG